MKRIAIVGGGYRAGSGIALEKQKKLGAPVDMFCSNPAPALAASSHENVTVASSRRGGFLLSENPGLRTFAASWAGDQLIGQRRDRKPTSW